MEKEYSLPILIYDQQCALCVRFILSLEKLPGSEEITFVPLQDNNIYKRYPFLKKSNCKKTLHVVDNKLEVHVGGNAISYLVLKFPAVEKFSWLIESGMGQKTIDFFYEIANKYRESLLNRCPNCKKSK